MESAPIPKAPPGCFVRNYLTDLPQDITSLIWGMVTHSIHSDLMNELSHSVGHFASKCNPEMSFIRISHLHKMVQYSYFKPTATLRIHNHTFGNLVRCLV